MKNFNEFLTEKGITQEQFEAKSAGEMSTLYNEYNEMANKSIQEAVENKASKEDINAMKEEITASIQKRNEVTEKAIQEQGVALKKLMTSNDLSEFKSEGLEDAINKAMKDNEDAIKAFANGSSTKVSFDFNVNKATTLTTSVSGSTLAMRDDTPLHDSVQEMPLENAFPRGTVGANNGGTIRYVEWDAGAITRAAASVAEGIIMPEDAIGWIERSATAIKIGVMQPMSKEALNDFAFVGSEVRNFVEQDLRLEIDRQRLAGNGTTELNGIQTLGVANAFVVPLVATDFYQAFPTASIEDLMAVVNSDMRESASFSRQYIKPNIVIMHPVDITTYGRAKDANGLYLFPEFARGLTDKLAGMTIVESDRVTKGTLLMADTLKSTEYDLRAVSVEFSENYNDDWGKDLVRVKATARKLLLTKNLHEIAYMQVADIAAALTAITAP